MSDFEAQFKKLAKKLKRDSAPDSAWLKSSRKEMLSIVKGASRGSVERFSSPVKSSFFARNLRAVSVAIVLALIIGSGTALVAQGAEPGNVLYPIKLMSEDMSLKLAVFPGARARLHMKYANRRMAELEMIYEKGFDSKLEETVSMLANKHLDESSSRLSELESVSEISDMSLMLEEMMRVHIDRMSEIREKASTSTERLIDKRIEKQEEYRVRAIEMLKKMQNRLEELDENTGQIENRINKRLEMLENRRSMRGRMHKDKNKNLRAMPDMIDSSKGGVMRINTDEQMKKRPESRNFQNQNNVEVDFNKNGESIMIDIEGVSDGDVKIERDDDNGTTRATIKVESGGGSVYIKNSSNIDTTSSRNMIINGKEVETR